MVLLSGLCQATELSTASKQEIAHLFSYLENSNCQFNRNGSWHTAKEAAAHLQEKYQSVLNKDLISNAESFIDNVASKSSITGTHYQVKCGEVAPVQSALWFKMELDKYRKTGM